MSTFPSVYPCIISYVRKRKLRDTNKVYSNFMYIIWERSIKTALGSQELLKEHNHHVYLIDKCRKTKVTTKSFTIN